MARTHLYQPVLKPDGTLCVYAAVTFLDSVTGLPTTEPLYADEVTLDPLPNPTQFSPGVIEVWADNPVRLDLRVTADLNYATVIPGVDMNPAPEEMLVIPGGMVVDAPSLQGQVFERTSGGASWENYLLLPAHQHDGFSTGSTVLGDAKDPTTNPFTTAGASGGSLNTPISASAGGATAAVAIQWKALEAAKFKTVRVYCTRLPTGTGGVTVGIASAIGTTPAGVTWIQRTLAVNLIKGWNVVVLPASVTVVAGTQYYVVVQSTGQDVNALDTTGGVLTGSGVGVADVGGTGIPLSLVFQHVSGDHNLMTFAATFAAGEGYTHTVQMQYAAHISKGAFAHRYYIGLGVAAPSGSSTSVTVNFKLPSSSTFNPVGTVDVIDFYSLLYWYNQAAQVVTPAFADSLPTGTEIFRIKTAAGSMLRGIVGAPTGQTEPVISTATTSATAWSASSTIFGVFEVGDVSGIVDNGTDATWVGINSGDSENVLNNTTALGADSYPTADNQVLLGADASGLLDSTGALSTGAVVMGVGSYAVKNSVILGTNYYFTGQTAPVVWTPQLYVQPTLMNLGPVYVEAAGTGEAWLGVGSVATTTATVPFHFEIDVWAPGPFQVLGNVILGHAASLVGFHNSNGVAKPTTFAHQTNVALQNLLVALQALGLVVSS